MLSFLHAADLHLCALSKSNQVLSRCSLWWKHVPPCPGHVVGTLGHYSSADNEAAKMLLSAATDCLRSQGCSLAIGPMDGNTWRRYRFVTDHGSEPPFFLEPSNPAEWPAQFEQAGFGIMASYFSALNADLSQADLRIQSIAERLSQSGVTLRSAQPDKISEELPRIYRVSRTAFTRNFLYTELPEAAFMEQYQRVLPHVRAELVLLAERNSDPVGFLFAVPDLAQAARGLRVDTFIIKTVAILPDRSLTGLGSLLVARAQEIGHQLGYRRCIHALMYESNISLNISRHYAQPMRKYTLYSKDLRR